MQGEENLPALSGWQTRKGFEQDIWQAAADDAV
jgi:hypothetical protein